MENVSGTIIELQKQEGYGIFPFHKKKLNQVPN